MRPRWEGKVPYCNLWGCDEHGECPFETAGFKQCEPATRRMTETLEALIAWDDFGGDAPEMLQDAVNAARKATE